MTSSGTSAMAPAPATPIEMKKGTELKGRYVVSEHVGTGGYASVWRATDKELNRDVAIKRLLRDHWRGASPEDVQKVLEEGRNAARLKGHRNIVEVYEVIEDSGEAFLVMEYVDGPSLDRIFKEHALKGDWIPVSDALDYLNQILEGLVFAHSSGLIHRDVKPSNILVSKLGVAKLADFGIARPMPFTRGAAAPAAEQGFAATGSQSFMSYEQSRGEQLDQQTDIFSAGIVAYILLTGRHPFNHPSAAFSVRRSDPGPDRGHKGDEGLKHTPQAIRRAWLREIESKEVRRSNRRFHARA
jgi:eukaryotic-like serine/threonine-protein kinase